MYIVMSIIVGFLAVVGIAAAIAHYLQEPYNPGFLELPIITTLHIVLGAIYLAFAPFQFVKRIRTRWLNYHRLVGRVLVALGLVVGVTALIMGFVIPFSGWSESLVMAVFGSLFLFALVKGFLEVRAGHIARHREWMIRAFAIGLAIATMRLIFIPALLLTVEPTEEQIARLSIMAFAIAFVLHSLLAEAWIRVTRKPTSSVKNLVKTNS
jgi:uncharacterized membrane protein